MTDNRKHKETENTIDILLVLMFIEGLLVGMGLLIAIYLLSNLIK